MARNLAVDAYRARQRRPAEVPQEMAGDFPGSGDPDQLVQLLALAAALAGLSAARRDVIVALYYRGLTIAETAEALAVPGRHRQVTVCERARGAPGGAGCLAAAS